MNGHPEDYIIEGFFGIVWTVVLVVFLPVWLPLWATGWAINNIKTSK